MQETRERRPKAGFEWDEEWSKHLKGTTVAWHLGQEVRERVRNSMPMK